MPKVKKEKSDAELKAEEADFVKRMVMVIIAKEEEKAREAFIKSLDDYDVSFIVSLCDRIYEIQYLESKYRDLYHKIPHFIRSVRSGLNALKKKFGANYKYLESRYSLYLNDEDEKDPFKALEELKVYHKGKEINFLSEGFLYEAVGKDSAREILGLVAAIKQSIGKT